MDSRNAKIMAYSIGWTVAGLINHFFFIVSKARSILFFNHVNLFRGSFSMGIFYLINLSEFGFLYHYWIYFSDCSSFVKREEKKNGIANFLLFDFGTEKYLFTYFYKVSFSFLFMNTLVTLYLPIQQRKTYIRFM